MDLVASQHLGAFWIRDQTCVPRLGRQILNHWTTREFQNMKDNILFFFFFFNIFNIFYLYLIFVSLINMCLSVFLFKFFYFIINLLEANCFTILYWFCHTAT